MPADKLRPITATQKDKLTTQKHGVLHGFFNVGNYRAFALIEYADGNTEELCLDKYQIRFTDKV